MQHPIDNMMQTTMESIRSMVDVNTVVGSPVLGSKGTTIIPVSKVSFGFVAGGGEYTTEDRQRGRSETPEGFPFAGGTGAGVSVQPVGFLVVGEGTVKMLPAQSSGAMERMVDLLPQVLEEFKAQDPSKSNHKGKRKPFERYPSQEDETEEDELRS
ncbi:MAG: sporulation protein YtfJ [Clostridiales bacterium]|nr:sporulation protein YtfJ [Clostridiales bacterium]